MYITYSEARDIVLGEYPTDEMMHKVQKMSKRQIFAIARRIIKKENEKNLPNDQISMFDLFSKEMEAING